MTIKFNAVCTGTFDDLGFQEDVPCEITMDQTDIEQVYGYGTYEVVNIIPKLNK